MFCLVKHLLIPLQVLFHKNELLEKGPTAIHQRLHDINEKTRKEEVIFHTII